MADPGPRSGADVTQRNGRVAKELGQDVSFKVLMIGDSSVGKTATLGRFTEDNFPHSFISTVGRLGEEEGEGRGLQCAVTAAANASDVDPTYCTPPTAVHPCLLCDHHWLVACSEP